MARMRGAGWRSTTFLFLIQHSARKTHFLNPSSAFILDLLAEAPRTFRDISAALSHELGVELTAGEAAQLASHVQRLEALGLIERTLSCLE